MVVSHQIREISGIYLFSMLHCLSSFSFPPPQKTSKKKKNQIINVLANTNGVLLEILLPG